MSEQLTDEPLEVFRQLELYLMEGVRSSPSDLAAEEANVRLFLRKCGQ